MTPDVRGRKSYMQKTAKGECHCGQLALCQVLSGQHLREWLPSEDLAFRNPLTTEVYASSICLCNLA